MGSKKPLTDNQGEVRELTEEDLKDAKLFSELPKELKRKLGKRGPQKSPVKTPVSIRLSPEVIEHFKSQGNGWQTRIDDALKEYIGIVK